MKDSMPIGEINVDEIIENAKKYRKTLLNLKKEEHKEKIEELNETDLISFTNNKSDGVYKPYLLEFGLLLNRLKDKDGVYNMKELQIRIDIIEQILKMKNVPPFSTECHIESKDIDKCTSIKSLVLKKIFGDNKYRLIFHKREATFQDKYFKSNIKTKFTLLTISEFILLILSISVFNNYILFLIFLTLILFTMFLMA